MDQFLLDHLASLWSPTLLQAHVAASRDSIQLAKRAFSDCQRVIEKPIFLQQTPVYRNALAYMRLWCPFESECRAFAYWSAYEYFQKFPEFLTTYLIHATATPAATFARAA